MLISLLLLLFAKECVNGIGIENTGILLSECRKEYTRLLCQKRKEKEPFDPKNLKPEELLKYEIAEELGLSDKVMSGGWRSLTTKESGRNRRTGNKAKTRNETGSSQRNVEGMKGLCYTVH